MQIPWTTIGKRILAVIPILMFVTSPGCPHCVKMISQTYQAPHISPLVRSR